MGWTRRQFLTLGMGLSLTSCAKMKLHKLPLVDKVGLDFGGGKDATFTFATIADLHVNDAASTAIVGRAVSQLNANKDVAFVVVIGDVATDGRLTELNLAKTAISGIEKPWYVVPGNHDVDMTRKDFYANYENVFGPTQWVHEHEGWVLIGLDSCNATASDVAIPADRMEWLGKQLKGIHNNRPIALFVHHPFNPHTKAYRVKNADEVLALFAGHDLKLVASGHYHGNQVEEQNGVMFTTTACCSSTRGNHDGTNEKGYRLFHVNKGVLDTEFVVVPE